MKTMVLAGSKGSNLNISQIAGLVGQQNIEGKRITDGFMKRTQPHFVKDDLGPKPRGFVASSFLEGLTPEEFFFHTMGGREGIIDTAVKTSQTGYMQRRLVKAMEDVMIQYDSTVRDSYGNIVQFLYGEDGIAGEYIEEQHFNLLKDSDEKIAANCCFFEIDESKHDLGFDEQIQRLYEEEKISNAVRENQIENQSAHKILKEELLTIYAYRDELRRIFTAIDEQADKGSRHLPVNIQRLITHAQFNINDRGKSDLNPIDVVSDVKNQSQEQQMVHGKDNLSKITNANALKFFKAFLFYSLSSRKVILDYRLSKDAFRFLLNEIRERLRISQVHPGEMVGSIAAQSQGETLTQMTLNTFHFAGVSEKNITLGVPRIQEIINCTKKIKGESMTIYLKPEYRCQQDKALELMSQLEFTTVKHVATVSEIYYDPNPALTIIEEDQDLIWIEEGDQNQRFYSPWLLRIQIDADLLARKCLKQNNIIQAIEKFFAEMPMDIVESLETADPIIVRLRRKYDAEKSQEDLSNQYHDLKKIEQFILDDMPIKGFCKKVAYRQEPHNIYTRNGIETEGQEYILETSGTDLRKIFEFRLIDPHRTTSNHVIDIYNVLGIEAARKTILREIRIVLNFFNIYVNYRHITLLADVITSGGRLMSISRNGINRVYPSALRKSSFEETVEILLEASVFAELDQIRGVTENVMMGQTCKIGTGSFDVLMDKYYFFAENDTQKEKISAEWKYFPDTNPYIGESGEMVGDDYADNQRTPRAVKTPGPCTDIYGKKTPQIVHEIDGQFAKSPHMFTSNQQTPGICSRGFMSPRAVSPHNHIYSPYVESLKK